MQSIIITYLALQLTLLQHLPHVFCQQFSFNNNPQIPARFLVPGGFSAPNTNQQGKRLLVPSPQQQPQQQSQSVDDEGLPRFRKPILRTRPAIDPPTNGFGFGPESAFSSDQTPRAPPAQADGSVLQSETEDQTEETFSSPFSTFEPTPINTLPLRTLRPSTFQPRPTTRPPSPPSPPFVLSSSPQPFFRPNINQLEDDEEEEDASPSPVPNTEATAATPRRPVIDNTIQQFPRRPSPSPIHRINTIQSKPSRIQPQQQQPLSSELSDNKLVRQYEKVPAKTKFEKSDVPEKRGKKPVAQVLRRYRDDNPDGSITWGFENDDGSYKEETIGNDCITRGKYGYIDPDGMRREYSYSQGLPCDKTKTEQEDEEKQSGGYIDYAHNKVVLANGESVDMNNMVKNRQRKPVNLRVNRSKDALRDAEAVDPDTTNSRSRQRKQT